MKYNKGFSSVAIIMVIVVVLVIVGGAYYLGKKSNIFPTGGVSNNLSNENRGVVNSKTDCLPTATPWIKVISPNGGETYHLGESVIFKWTSCNLDSNVSGQIYGVSNPNDGYALFGEGGPGALNIGQQVVTLNAGRINPGTYKFTIGKFNDNIIVDSSDNFFTIENQNSLTLTQSQAEAIVYKEWGDCSSGDCGGVSVIVSQNSIGQYIVTAIFTELDDSTSQTKKISTASYKNGTWVLGQPTVTRTCHRGHVDGTLGFSGSLCI